MKWRRVTIVGCGLMGGSFALALRQNSLAERIAGWDVSREALGEALRLGIIDEVDEAFNAADLIYLAAPVNEIKKFLSERACQDKEGAIITDAGSTKREIVDAARAHMPEDRFFVGGHPVAGSHLRGVAHSRAELFNGAPYVLVQDFQTNEEALNALKETIESTGARVRLMSAEEHDRAMAFVSHLPQLVSSALAKTVGSQPDSSSLQEISGTGFRDMTRLAESSWDVWRDIFMTNAAPAARALDILIRELADVRDELIEFDSEKGSELALTKLLFKSK